MSVRAEIDSQTVTFKLHFDCSELEQHTYG